MSKPFIFLTITLFFFLTIFTTLTYLYKTSPQLSAQAFLEDPITSLPPPPAYNLGAALYLSPQEITIQPGSSSSLEINIGSDGEYPTETQLELSYDPNILTNVSINPGEFFPNPNILLNHIDQNTGRISYAIQLPPEETPTKRAGIIATISFTANPEIQKAKTKINFLQKTAVKSNGQLAKLKETTGSEIFVLPPLNIETPSPQLNP